MKQMGVLLFRAGQAGGMHQQEPRVKPYLGQHSKHGVRIDWLERAGQERPWGPDRPRVEHGPAVCLWQRRLMAHWAVLERVSQQFKAGDPTPLLCAGKTHLECWV